MTSELGRFDRDLSDLIRARFPIVQVMTFEEDRALKVVLGIAERIEYRTYVWSVTRGVVDDFASDVNVGSHTKNTLTDFRAAVDHCEKIAQSGRKSLLIFLDPYPFISERSSEAAHRRRLREFAMNIRTRAYNATCVIIAPSFNVAHELETEISLVDFPLPDRALAGRHDGERAAGLRKAWPNFTFAPGAYDAKRRSSVEESR